MRHLNRLLPGVLLALCIFRLWIMPLRSSFWLDEMETVFVTRYGSAHWSLAETAPQAWKSIYYPVARVSAAWFGSSEIAFRLPSILLMGLSLFLIARLAARLIHPRAGWFAVFACLTLRGINYEAADARPYALGMCVAAAALLFLVRWFDSMRWRDGRCLSSSRRCCGASICCSGRSTWCSRVTRLSAGSCNSVPPLSSRWRVCRWCPCSSTLSPCFAMRAHTPSPRFPGCATLSPHSN